MRFIELTCPHCGGGGVEVQDIGGVQEEYGCDGGGCGGMGGLRDQEPAQGVRDGRGAFLGGLREAGGYTGDAGGGGGKHPYAQRAAVE